jgi:hypothetical protein
MPNTFTLIEAKTVSTPSASIVFSNIPATYTDLKILYTGKTSDANAQGTAMTYNAGASSAAGKYIIGDGANPSTGNLGYMYAGSAWGTNGTSGLFSASEIYIPNYTSSQVKSYICMNAAEKQDPTSFSNVIVGRDTGITAPLTSITLLSGPGNWIANCTFYLYGIKSS